MVTGGTYMKLYSIKKYSKNLGPITSWDVVEKPFFKWVNQDHIKGYSILS